MRICRRRRHGSAAQTRVLALDVEVTDLAEVEQPLVELAPEAHASAVHVVREMVDDLQAVPTRVPVHALDELEVDVVDAPAVFIPVDQVQRRPADALDRRQAQLHGARGHVHGLRAQLQRAGVGLVGVAHAEGHGAGAGPVLGREVTRQALGLAVHDEVDVTLAVEQHVLAAVARHQREAHFLEQGFQGVRGGRCEFHELEAAQAHGVVEQLSHEKPPEEESGCA